MHALLHRLSGKAGELSEQYSDEFSRRASGFSDRASELSDAALGRWNELSERAKERASRLYSQAQDHPRAMATALAIVAVGIVAAGVWGFLRYRERRIAASRRSSAAQSARRKRVKAGRAATAS